MNDGRKQRKRKSQSQVDLVKAILRRWDPIGVQPGEVAPADEYDSYAPHIVSLIAQGCSVDELFRHLGALASDSMGVGSNPERDRDIAKEIVGTLRKI